MKTKLMILAVMLLSLQSCGDSIRLKNGSIAECYGLMDKDEVKVEGIRYESVTSNVVWGAIGFGTIALPVWLYGYKLYCPIAE